MENVRRKAQNTLDVLVSLVATALELCTPSMLISTDVKKKWLVAISPYLVFITVYCPVAQRLCSR
jgi:hypothetical protein